MRERGDERTPDGAEGAQHDDVRNRALYTDLLSRHGASPRALNWGSRESQRLRFRILFEAGIPRDASVLDAGCGTGDFLAYLRERGFEGRYVGIDLTPAMIEAASKRFPGERFAVASIGDAAGLSREAFASDFVVSSGVFYYRQADPERFLHESLERLFPLARRCLAFNSLSTWADRPAEAGEFRADPLRTLSFCRRLSPRLTLRHDYHPGDFTVYVRRPAASVDGTPDAGE